MKTDEATICRIIGQIKPHISEVENMSEEDWGKYAYPIKCFRRGELYNSQKFLKITSTIEEIENELCHLRNDINDTLDKCERLKSDVEVGTRNA